MNEIDEIFSLVKYEDQHLKEVFTKAYNKYLNQNSTTEETLIRCIYNDISAGMPIKVIIDDLNYNVYTTDLNKYGESK